MTYFNDSDYSLGALAWNSQSLGNITQFTYDADGDIVTMQKVDYNAIVVEETTFEYYPDGVVSVENASGKKKLKSITTTVLNKQ